MSLIRPAQDGTEYIWKYSNDTDITPTLSYLRSGIEAHSDLTTQETIDLITGLTVFDDKAACKSYIITNIANYSDDDE